VSRGTSGEAAGRLGEEKVGVTAGIVTKEHTAKGYIRPSKSPYAAPFFFIKKKDGKLRPVQDY